MIKLCHKCYVCIQYMTYVKTCNWKCTRHNRSHHCFGNLPRWRTCQSRFIFNPGNRKKPRWKNWKGVLWQLTRPCQFLKMIPTQLSTVWKCQRHWCGEVFIEGPDIQFRAGWETGRASEPAFMDMNLHALRRSAPPKVVLYQYDATNELNPHGLLIAYAEEYERHQKKIRSVKPVVSDFDTFTIGSIGMTYEPLPESQADLMLWSLEQARGILSKPGQQSWNSRWLEVLQKANREGFHPTIPQYGFGDPTSYRLVEEVVKATSISGAVRHGAECFNFYFPQEFDSGVPCRLAWISRETLGLLRHASPASLSQGPDQWGVLLSSQSSLASSWPRLVWDFFSAAMSGGCTKLLSILVSSPQKRCGAHWVYSQFLSRWLPNSESYLTHFALWIVMGSLDDFFYSTSNLQNIRDWDVHWATLDHAAHHSQVETCDDLDPEERANLLRYQAKQRWKKLRTATRLSQDQTAWPIAWTWCKSKKNRFYIWVNLQYLLNKNKDNNIFDILILIS